MKNGSMGRGVGVGERAVSCLLRLPQRPHPTACRNRCRDGSVVLKLQQQFQGLGGHRNLRHCVGLFTDLQTRFKRLRRPLRRRTDTVLEIAPAVVQTPDTPSEIALRVQIFPEPVDVPPAVLNFPRRRLRNPAFPFRSIGRRLIY